MGGLGEGLDGSGQARRSAGMGKSGEELAVLGGSGKELGGAGWVRWGKLKQRVGEGQARSSVALGWVVSAGWAGLS